LFINNTGLAGILGCDKMHIPQCAQGTRTDICQVAYRRRDQVKGAHMMILSLKQETRFLKTENGFV
jgi:hypothetical protein